MSASAAEPDRVELRRHVVIVGPMGAGKTTLGTALAGTLGVAYLDNDADIGVRRKSTGREIAELQGVPALHDIEAQILLRHLDHPQPSVIAAAASVVESPTCRLAMTAHATVCWIDITAAELVRRLGHGDHRRSMDAAEVRRLHVLRTARFEQVADVRVDALDSLPERVETVMGYLRRHR